MNGFTMDAYIIGQARKKMAVVKAEKNAVCKCRVYTCRNCKKLKKSLCRTYHQHEGSRRSRAQAEIMDRSIYEVVFGLVDPSVVVQEMLQGAPVKGVRDPGHDFRMMKLYQLVRGK